jgi:hypothetical protein
VLSLNMDGFPEELRKTVDDRMNRHGMGPYFEHSPIHGLIEKIRSLEQPRLKMNMIINKNYEVEKVVREFSGRLKDENNVEHDWNIKAELSMAW